jgi:hypothetical protein
MTYQVIVAALWRTKCEIPVETQNAIKYPRKGEQYVL